MIAIIAVFAVSGCTTQEATGAFAGGTDGLTASFINLPTSVFTESTFDINLLLQNKGEADIPVNAALLSLNNAGTLGITEASKSNIKNLNKVRRINDTIIAGGSEPISWQSASFKGAAITEQQAVPFSVNVCYPYATTAIAAACAGKTDKVCNPIEEKPVQSSGAPIQVTRLMQVAVPKATGVELAFTIDVENKGEGDVYGPGSICAALSPDQKDIVTIKSIIFNGEPKTADCINAPISLSENQGSITCNFDVNVAQDFSAELVVQLNYVYRGLLNGAITVIPV